MNPVMNELDKRLKASGMLDDKRKITVVLFDGDILTWRASAVTDGRVYTCKDGIQFKYKKEAVAHCTDVDLEVSDIIQDFVPEPLGHATHNIDEIVRNALEHLNDQNDEGDNQVYPFFFQSSKQHFRENINEDYKGHRVEMRTPANLVGCKSYLDLEYDSITIDPYEADDLLGICNTYLHEKGYENVYIASIDKDLLMLPAKHFNLNDFSTYHPTSIECEAHLYKQILMGDRTDNIDGLPGIGPKRAEQALIGCADTADFTTMTLGKYMEVLKVDAIDAFRAMLKTAHQIYILQNHEVYYKPDLVAVAQVFEKEGGDMQMAVELTDQIYQESLALIKGEKK